MIEVPIPTEPDRSDWYALYAGMDYVVARKDGSIVSGATSPRAALAALRVHVEEDKEQAPLYAWRFDRPGMGTIVQWAAAVLDHMGRTILVLNQGEKA